MIHLLAKKINIANISVLTVLFAVVLWH